MSDDLQQKQLHQADELRLLGDYEQAIKNLTALVESAPFFAPAKLLLGRCYFESGVLDQALKVLEEFIEFVPDHSLANKILAKIYVHEKQYAQALEKIQRVLVQDPEDAIAIKLQKEIPTSFDEEDLEADDTVKTSMPTLTPTMAELYYHQGHLEEARKIYETLLKHDPLNESLQEKLRLTMDSRPKDPEPQPISQAQAESPQKQKVDSFAHTMKKGKKEILELLLMRIQKRGVRHV